MASNIAIEINGLAVVVHILACLRVTVLVDRQCAVMFCIVIIVSHHCDQWCTPL